MLKNILLGGALLGGSYLAYDWLQKKKKEKAGQPGQLKALPGTAITLTTRPGAEKVRKFAGVRPGVKKVTKFSMPTRTSRPGVTTMPTRTSAPRTSAPIRTARPGIISMTAIRPQTLSECCKGLCLPMERETRPGPPLINRISTRRNLWQDYYNC